MDVSGKHFTDILQIITPRYAVRAVPANVPKLRDEAMKPRRNNPNVL